MTFNENDVVFGHNLECICYGAENLHHTRLKAWRLPGGKTWHLSPGGTGSLETDGLELHYDAEAVWAHYVAYLLTQ